VPTGTIRYPPAIGRSRQLLANECMTLAHGIRLPCDVAKIEERRAAERCPQRDKPWVLATAILGSSLAFIEGSIVNLALPAMQTGLHLSSTQLQWVINAYLLTLGSGMLIGGSLGDRFGLRRVFAIGTAIFGIGALACAFATSLPMLVFARLVQGAGGALLVPGSLALIGTHFEEHERGRAIGTWAGASALTTALGPVVGGALVDHWSWPAVFMLVAPLAFATVALALWRVPVSKPQTNQPLDSVGTILLALCLASLIYALVAQGGGSLRWTCAVLSLFCGGGFIWRQHTFSSPVVPFRLFASRTFTGANLMTLALYFALNGVMYFLPFNLIQVRGYSATMAGAIFLPMTLILGFGSTLAGDAIRKLNPRRVLTLGSLIAALGRHAGARDSRRAGKIVHGIPARHRAHGYRHHLVRRAAHNNRDELRQRTRDRRRVRHQQHSSATRWLARDRDLDDDCSARVPRRARTRSHAATPSGANDSSARDACVATRRVGATARDIGAGGRNYPSRHRGRIRSHVSNSRGDLRGARSLE
jgi:EmrB/QacA subfamily drug resistance transporter